MTIKGWADLLNGRQYGEELTRDEEILAKNDGVLILFGASDDLLEFRGITDDEISAWEGINIGFARAIWCPTDENGDVWASWHITSSLPHESFNIWEDGNIYCRGAVFQMGEKDD